MTMQERESRFNLALANLASLNDGWAESHTSPSELFDRLRFVLLKELEGAERAVGQYKARARVAEEMAEDIKSRAIFEVEGRNEAERKANLGILLEHHGLYQEARQEWAKVAGCVIDAEAVFHRLQREWTALTLQVQLRIAVLNFLAAGQ